MPYPGTIQAGKAAFLRIQKGKLEGYGKAALLGRCFTICPVCRADVGDFYAASLDRLSAGIFAGGPNYGAGNMGWEENPGHTIAQRGYGMPVLAAALAVLCCGDGCGPARREYSKSRCFCRGIQLNPAIAAQKLVGAVLS